MILPLTIIKDAFDGRYSHAQWLAFNLRPSEVPVQFQHDDAAEQFIFFDLYENGVDIPVGRGETVEEAITDLEAHIKMNQSLKKMKTQKSACVEGYPTASISKELNEMKKFL